MSFVETLDRERIQPRRCRFLECDAMFPHVGVVLRRVPGEQEIPQANRTGDGTCIYLHVYAATSKSPEPEPHGAGLPIDVSMSSYEEMTDKDERSVLSVAETKRRFSELIDRVERGEQILVSRRGKLVLALVRPHGERARPAPLGLAAVAGALADWDDLDATVADIYARRRRANDRPVPELD